MNASDGWSAPPTPEPVRQQPPDDRFCDLILNGGVASGVVYPWAVVELARHYRFRSIGGNSVGAMAAALAAAAEYGRCSGNANAFEVLRRAPLDLAEEEDGKAQMLRLFQPTASVRRLFDCLVAGVRHFNASIPGWLAWLLTIRDVFGEYRLGRWWLAGVLVFLLPAAAHADRPQLWATVLVLATAVLAMADFRARNGYRYVRGAIILAILGLVAGAHVAGLVTLAKQVGLLGFLPAGGALAWVLVVVALALARLAPELHALKANGYGLCTGKAQPDAPGEEPREKALVEWLHEGIQRSAGRERHDAPLTFEDLWNAPRFGKSAPGAEESISLQMFSTNLTLARPVVWPLRDRNTRLFFRLEEWERIFPPTLLKAVRAASVPYTPATDSDPPASPKTEGLYELPAGRMPIAVAARLSLSFPLLFTCVPVHAIDYEGTRGQRVLRQCQLTDGGVCTNFPIHLFDAAHPRWPTFGLMLSRRLENRGNESVWLPEYHVDGRADNWLRSVPGAELGPSPGPVKGLFGLLGGMVATALEWNDNLISRLPHARNRVLRMALRRGEGQLHITMPRRTILKMAHEYGTLGGLELIRLFKSDTGLPTDAWQEHLYVRGVNQLRALAEHLRGYADAVTAAGYNRPLGEILADACRRRPLRDKPNRAADPLGAKLTPRQEAALQDAVKAVAALEQVLVDAEAEFGPYQPVPETKLHLRSRI